MTIKATKLIKSKFSQIVDQIQQIFSQIPITGIVCDFKVQRLTISKTRISADIDAQIVLSQYSNIWYDMKHLCENNMDMCENDMDVCENDMDMCENDMDMCDNAWEWWYEPPSCPNGRKSLSPEK